MEVIVFQVTQYVQCNVSSLTISSNLKIIANTKINNSAVDFDIVYLKRDMNYIVTKSRIQANLPMCVLRMQKIF